MKHGYLVEYSDDLNEVCIIPKYWISSEESIALSKIFMDQGYEWWLHSDERRGYLYCKDLELYYKKNP